MNISLILSGISRIRFSPFYEPCCDSAISSRFKKICVFASSNWGPLTVYVNQYPWNPRGLDGPLQRPRRHHHAHRCRKGGWCGWKPSSGSNSSLRAFRAQIYQFEFFELILRLKLDKQLPVERFEAAVSQSAVPSPPLLAGGGHASLGWVAGLGALWALNGVWQETRRNDKNKTCANQ